MRELKVKQEALEDISMQIGSVNSKIINVKQKFESQLQRV